MYSGADPGFLIGWGANPPGGGANIQICQIFPKNCMKLRKFWSMGGGHAPGAPPWIRHLYWVLLPVYEPNMQAVPPSRRVKCIVDVVLSYCSGHISKYVAHSLLPDPCIPNPCAPGSCSENRFGGVMCTCDFTGTYGDHCKQGIYVTIQIFLMWLFIGVGNCRIWCKNPLQLLVWDVFIVIYKSACP